MKRVIAACCLAGVSSVALADGYFGAVLALSKIQSGCSSGYKCDQVALGGRLYGGTKLKPSQVVDLGGLGSINAMEVGYIRPGNGKSSGNKVIRRYNPDLADVEVVSVPATETVEATVIYAALVSNFPLDAQTSLSAKLGVAYVSSTLLSRVDGVSDGGQTATKFKPYLGLGAAYSIGDGLSLTGSFDFTQYDVVGRKGNITALGFGAQKSF